ncbi:potassium channel family protein [Spirosoma luteum]|uniref:potassium channel family protein n=1 Tax=Spirosoma luteum TaxID=431553 RepID=UPI00035CF937|nr:potassium channel family protein [Spirosoma luteum]
MRELGIFFRKRKYELLLCALLQHLFIGIFLSDLPAYTKIIWPINMAVLGIFSTGVFIGKSRHKIILRNILFVLTILLPLALTYATDFLTVMLLLNVTYVVFFIFIFIEISRFLVKPGYIDIDIISASACGYLLLIEISVFLFQAFYYNDVHSFKGIDISSPAGTFMDFVYFCSITFTSIGFGDITPNQHHTRLTTALLGIVGQFYSVVLIGILISKFSSNHKIVADSSETD